MSRKTLLSEAQVRQFLKLADLGAVGDAKIQEMYGMPGARDEEDPDMDMGAGEDGAMDMGMDAEDEPDMDMDMDVPDEENSAAGMVSVDDFMGALESALEDVMGEPTSVEMDMDDEPDMDMDDEPDMDMDMGGAPDDEDEPDPMMEEEKEEEDVVNEVARRVAARLTKKNKNEQLVDQLAERILSRLTKK